MNWQDNYEEVEVRMEDYDSEYGEEIVGKNKGLLQ
jgi:hypothetical protein